MNVVAATKHSCFGRLVLEKFKDVIISRMSGRSRNEQLTVRVIRDGLSESQDNDWSTSTREERIEAVWTLTELCMGWNQPSTRAPRLQRTVTRIQRAPR